MRFRLVAVIFIAVFLALPVLSLSIGRVGTGYGNTNPVASFTYSPAVPMPGETITFDASASHDADGLIVSYTWNFGDGNVVTVASPTATHSYPVDGNYTVELRVTDDGGASGVSVVVVQVSTVAFFRVVYSGTVIPMANVKVTTYYYSGSAWVKAPVGPSELEIKYDNKTQPNLANTDAERFRNPGYTASILRCNASNIGFDVHPSTWKVFFKFEWGSYVAYWPNEPSRVFSYKNGIVETHYYASGHQAYWDASASSYVIRVYNIPKDGVSPTESHPIIVPLCPPSSQKYYLTVRTDPLGITIVPGEGWYVKDTDATSTAPSYVNLSSSLRYRFSYWDVDGTSKGSGVNPITVRMSANHTATAHYVCQYPVMFMQTGLSSDATGTVVTVDGVSKAYSELPFTKWVDSGSTVTYSYTSLVTSSTAGKRYRLSSVTGPASPITVAAARNVTGNYVIQYQVTFAQTGLDSTTTGTVVTVDSVAKTYPDLPYSAWFDVGSSVTYSFNQIVTSSTTGKRFNLVAVHCPPSPFTVTGPTTIIGGYCKQYQVTFAQSGLDSTATGTVVTVNGNAKLYTNLPFSFWVDSGASVTYVYNDIVLSTTTGKRFKQVSIAGPASPITVTGSTTATCSYKTQYEVTFDQSGVGSDFTGTVATVDSTGYGVTGLPVSFWWDSGSSHSFAYASPLTVNISKQYVWQSTSGLSTLQSGALTISGFGGVTGNYVVANRVTFDQVGASSDFTGTVLVVDGTPYGVGSLPVSFMWSIGSSHSLAFQTPLIVGANSKQYVWTSTTGLSTLRNGSITVSAFGSIIGHYKTQYYLNLATSPPGLATPSGSGWYDDGTYASISTEQYLPGGSRYRFNGWTTADMSEITDPTSTSTTVLVDQAKAVTAEYVHQYLVTFKQSGLGSDFTGTVVTIDSTGYGVAGLPVSFWWDNGSPHSFAYASPLVVNQGKQYDWVSTTGLSTLQNGTLTVTGSGTVTGNYNTHIKYQVTFSQSGVSSDFTGTVVVIDGSNYGVANLPVSFWWDSSSLHTFSFLSPLNVNPSKRYIWTSTTGLSTAQSDTITITGSGSVTGNYKNQYYLTVATNPSDIDSPTGTGWYDSGTNATISTAAFEDIVPGSSRYRFNGWTTGDMAEIADPMRSPTTVLMDKGKTVTANYATQYRITFNVAGVGSDYTGPVLKVDGINYTLPQTPTSFWWDKDSTHEFWFYSPNPIIQGKRYIWTSTTGLSTLQSGSITVTASGSVTGNYKTQYYLTIKSDYGSPTPPSDWYDAGSGITSTVASPWPGGSGTRHVCTGWTGTGNAPPPGTGTSVSFTLNAATNVTWNWKTQYMFTVQTDPSGLSPQPTRNPAGESNGLGGWWYDSSTSVTLTAQSVTGYVLSKWDVDSIDRPAGANPITVTMNTLHTATAHYNPEQPPLDVDISPMTASIAPSQLVHFTSTVTGGTTSYSCQWYLDGKPVAGATSTTWTFTPTVSGTYMVYLNVTDSHGNWKQSGIATVWVRVTGAGGYTVPTTLRDMRTPLLFYAMFLAAFATAISLIRRKKK